MSEVDRAPNRVLDLWWAFLAGDRVWIDSDEPPPMRVREVAMYEVVSYLIVLTQLWSPLVSQLADDRSDGLFLVAALAGTAACIPLMVRPVSLALGRATHPVPFLPRVVWRGLCFVVLVVATATFRPGWLALTAWPLALVAGTDVTITAWTLKIEARPARWWRRFIVSPLHFGVVGAICATFLFVESDAPRWELLGLYVAMHVGILVAGAVIVILTGYDAINAERRRRDRAALVEQERRHLAHWLHDDVLSEVRLAALRVQNGGATPEQVARELQELDHRLRLRQLDEVLEAGDVRLAEILQPHIRRAQSLGLEIGDVPSLDTMGRRVDTATGRLFGRAVAVLTSNAINAGAEHLDFRVRVEGDTITLEVTDDAGGFDFHAIPAGRGLDQLRVDVGDDRLTRIPEAHGSTMVVQIPIGSRPRPTAGAAATSVVPDPEPRR